MENDTLSILIPVYNEKETILKVLNQINEVVLPIKKEIIIIDDGSNDGTAELLRQLPTSEYKVLTKENGGKGSAIKLGLKEAQGTWVLFQDADLEYDPEDYQKFLPAIQENTTYVVMGSRVLSGSIHFGPKWTDMVTYCSTSIVAWLMNVLYGRHHSDYWAAYKLFRRDAIQDIPVQSNGFNYEIELLCRLMKKGVSIGEIPVSYHPRNYQAGKKIKLWPDAFLVIYTIVKTRFS